MELAEYRARRLVKKALAERSQSEIARALNITRGAVWKWARSGRIPPERVRDLEPLLGLKAEQMRPDIFKQLEPADG